MTKFRITKYLTAMPRPRSSQGAELCIGLRGNPLGSYWRLRAKAKGTEVPKYINQLLNLAR
jgi:hypothetical protein